ncbi:hypothetical protein VNO77_21874 [Canavalia gladiata]|uniref:Uncharacterized protein n=1 Tax=Canavalia gladiata TaxID=3824 RepID=A0AAN9QDZ6_CANGL
MCNSTIPPSLPEPSDWSLHMKANGLLASELPILIAHLIHYRNHRNGFIISYREIQIFLTILTGNMCYSFLFDVAGNRALEKMGNATTCKATIGSDGNYSASSITGQSHLNPTLKIRHHILTHVKNIRGRSAILAVNNLAKITSGRERETVRRGIKRREREKDRGRFDPNLDSW